MELLPKGQRAGEGKDAHRHVQRGVGEYRCGQAGGEQHLGSDRQYRRADESHHRRLEAGHTALDDGALLVFLIETGHDENDDKGGHHHAQGGAQGAEDGGEDGFASHLTAHVGGHIDGKGAGGGLCHRHEIDELLLGHPLHGDHRFHDQRKHGVPSPEGEGADL